MSYRILLVESDSGAASVMAQTLTDAGHRVASVASFQEAIRVSASDAPDLMIAALRLGAFNGLHLVLRLRAHDADLPVVIVGETSDFTADIRWFGARFLAKPIDLSSLRDVVSWLLAGRTPHDPRGARTWPRKRAELSATVQDGTARLVELSYGGVRLELARPPGAAQTPLEIKLPSLGISVHAVARWTRPAEDGGSWWCGAQVALPSSDAERNWRGIVDSLN